jgi:hydroxyacylglutathione hydrolase
MNLDVLQLGPYATNCYLLHTDKKLWVIDPGFDGDKIIEFASSRNLEIEAIILTHSHWDHVLGIAPIVDKYPKTPIYIGKTEAPYLKKEATKEMRAKAISIDPTQKQVPLSMFISVPEATHFLKDGDIIKGCNLLVIETPGHTVGSIALYDKENMRVFSGDTLFAGTVGRTDLPESRPDEILKSIKEKLFVLPKKTKVYPGHGTSSTIEDEIKFNPFFS